VCRWVVGLLEERADNPTEYWKFLEMGVRGKDLLSRRSFPREFVFIEIRMKGCCGE